MLEQLRQLGLSQEESEIYIAMLQLGGGAVSQIAKRAGRHRSTTYNTIANLVQRGMALRSKRGAVLFYSAESPEKLVRQAEHRLAVARGVLPELLSIENVSVRKPKITLYQRASGIEQIFEETLTAESEILGYTNLSLMIDLFPGFLRRYTKERIRRGIKVRYLSPRPTDKGEVLELFVPSSADEALLEVLFIDPKQFPFTNDIAIYGHKTAIMSLSKKEQLAVLIESETHAQTMKAIFDLAWTGASAFMTR